MHHKKTSLAAVAILSLGIGMSVAMFSLVDAVLLRPLPFPDQKSIQVIWKVDPQAGRYVEELAYPELRDLQENIRDFSYVAVMPTSLYGYARVLQVGKEAPVQIESTPVSHDFFRVLGVRPVMGRDFQASDERVGAPPVVIVSDRVWREQLGSDPRIVGRALRLNGQGYTVIGIMAPDVEFPRGAGFWFPLGVDKNVVENRRATFLQAIARAKPGVSHETVTKQVEALVRRLAIEHPEAYSPSQQAAVMPLIAYWSGSSRPQLWILLGASVLLLVASVLSAGILILSGVLARRAEIATRLALGAQQRQILSQLGAEGALMAGTAAIVGAMLAAFAVRFLVRWAPADIPRIADAGLNLDSICFSAICAIVAAVFCTLIPGIAAMRLPLESVLREGSGTRLSLSRRSLTTRNFFVLAQTALTVAMLAIAGLFVLSYRSMISADVGFSNRDALSVNLQLRGPGLFAGKTLDPQTRRAFYPQFLNRLRESPGVISAAAVLVRPLEGAIGWERGYEFEFEAGRRKLEVLPKANYEAISPDYFHTVGTPLFEGRDFSEHDTGKSEDVVIISRNLAERIRRAGYSPLGQRIRFGGDSDWRKIVGVCGNARYRNVTQEDASIFVPSLQAQDPHYLVIHGKQSASELSLLVRRILAQMDPTQAAAGDATIGELIGRNTAREQFNMILLLWFGVCAAVLAAMGIYGVIAETMAVRKQEIAIRAALGAPRMRLVRGILSTTLGFVLVGEIVGVGAVLLVCDRLAGLLYNVAPSSPVVLAGSTIFVFGISFGAGLWPAWSAADGGSSSELR